MSSPAGLQFSQADFLARWMPSSIRAGVILDPCADLAGSLRHTSAVGSQPLGSDDSFASDFAPLPASADSSCVGVGGFPRSPGGDKTVTDKSLNSRSSVPPRSSDGELDDLVEMECRSQGLPLMVKLEQVRQAFPCYYSLSNSNRPATSLMLSRYLLENVNMCGLLSRLYHGIPFT